MVGKNVRLTRRQVLGGSLAAGAAWATRRSCWAFSAQVDSQRLIFLSDAHVCGDRQRELRGVRPVDNFVATRDEILAARPRPAGVVITGDCAFLDGRPDDYQMLRELLTPVHEAGIPVHFALGNHDHRENFQQAFADWITPSPVPERHVTVIDTPRAALLVLDSLDLTNKTPGRLGATQLTWLAEKLDAQPQKPALILAHHNLEQPGGAAKFSALYDTEELLKTLLPRKQAKAYLFGHTHRWEQKAEADLPLLNLPTLVWVFDQKQPRGWVDVHLADEGMTLALNGLDHSHPAHGQCWPVKWR